MPSSRAFSTAATPSASPTGPKIPPKPAPPRLTAVTFMCVLPSWRSSRGLMMFTVLLRFGFKRRRALIEVGLVSSQRATGTDAGGLAIADGEPSGHQDVADTHGAVSYTHLRAHETDSYLVCRL